MSIALDEKELTEVKAFLSQYVSDHEESNDSALVRPNCYCMTQEEIEGEILDLVLTYLSRRYVSFMFLLCLKLIPDLQYLVFT